MKKTLAEKGVVIYASDTVFIGKDVDLTRIEAGAIIYPGCRIIGRHTYIGAGSTIGEESPVTIKNSQLGYNVRIAGGFLENTTMLDGSSAGDGFHSRFGTLIEEFANVAHTVGLKQTILMPYVTAGSLINFCDVLMAGGTDSQNHSEVGSSYVHFNFTPHQDKATASLLGDVPRGVMLDQRPIFLGGQGGMVGPRHVEFGTTVAAGSILRHDIVDENTLVIAGPAAELHSCEYEPRIFRNDTVKIAQKCLVYLGNIAALQAWYKYFRSGIMQRSKCGRACYDGALARLEEVWDERVKRLEQLIEKVKLSLKFAGENATGTSFDSQRKLVSLWHEIKSGIAAAEQKDTSPDKDILTLIEEAAGRETEGSVINAVKNMDNRTRRCLTEWLMNICNEVSSIL
ncbi:MAG: UDP-N-acetylglucosamine pyrophosphorylase [Lentisphaerae bacterium]|jgi:UDP-N-acetylglucosamine/UDP-N-acetylgalactosamine diphosphorylase|nr:UDP-N-acetylglucosamine pyrophosphorylase [Lentisphaerota bacterium]